MSDSSNDLQNTATLSLPVFCLYDGLLLCMGKVTDQEESGESCSQSVSSEAPRSPPREQAEPRDALMSVMRDTSTEENVKKLVSEKTAQMEKLPVWVRKGFRNDPEQ